MADEKKYKVAITVGVFDCFHQGHRNLLGKMAEAADELVVFIHDDVSTYLNKGRFPIQTWEHRRSNLNAAMHGYKIKVFPVFLINPGMEIANYISNNFQTKEEANKGAVYMRGDDWQDFPGRDMVEKCNVNIEFVKYTEGVSTTQIRKEVGV